MAKTHIMRFAPQDYRTSRARARSVSTRDPMLRLVYLEALFALYEAGGSLSADPSDLADELSLPAKEIGRCLPILDELARRGSGRGGLLIVDGQITNGRVSADLAREKEFSKEQAERGREGGKKRAASVRQADAEQPCGPPSPLPAPAPAPAPSPAPAPAAEPREGRTVSELTRAQNEAATALSEAVLATRRHADELLVVASETPSGNTIVRLDTCTSIPWLRATAQKLTAIRLKAQAAARDRPPPPPTAAAQARQDNANAMIRGGLRDRGKLDRGHEIAAGDDAGSGHDPGDAGAPRPALPAGPGTPDR